MDIAVILDAFKGAFGIILYMVVVIIVLFVLGLIIRLLGIDLYHPFTKLINFFKKSKS